MHNLSYTETKMRYTNIAESYVTNTTRSSQYCKVTIYLILGYAWLSSQIYGDGRAFFLTVES